VQRFDRYALSQLLVLFGFFALVLVAIFWVNRAVVLFDELISDGHSAQIFLEFSVLSLPAVIARILPLATFAAAVYVTNRLASESELTVLQAVGFSNWRLARPVLVFGLFIATMMLILSHVLVPKSLERLQQRELEIAGSISAKLMREGQFLHPSDGVTFYIRDSAPTGELTDVLLSDRRSDKREVIYTADTAYLVKDDEGPKIVMVSGIAQTLTHETGQLSTTNFSNLTYDISAMVAPPKKKRRKIKFIPTPELLGDPAAISKETNESIGEILEEAHLRFQQPLLCIVAALIGYATLVAGGFSRTGSSTQIILAIFLIVLVEFSKGMVTEPVRDNAALWPMVYLPPLFGAGIVALLLWVSSRRFRKGKAAAQGTAEQTGGAA
jgi:lipopolysaccharide export system permease protein